MTPHRHPLLLLAFIATGCTTSTVAMRSPTPFIARDHVGGRLFTGGIEGPAVGPDGALSVVNFGREGTIGRVTTRPDGSVHAALFATLPSGSIGNGIRFARDGTMLVADYTGHRILAVTSGDRRVSVFAPLPGADQPNDLALAPDGTHRSRRVGPRARRGHGHDQRHRSLARRPQALHQ